MSVVATGFLRARRPAASADPRSTQLPQPATAGPAGRGRVEPTAIAGSWHLWGHQGGGKSTLKLQAGTYIITGSFDVKGNATVTGSGVTLYFTCSAKPQGVTVSQSCQNGAGGSLDLEGGSTFTLTPPTCGTYAGLLVF